MLDFAETRNLACIRPIAGCYRIQHWACQLIPKLIHLVLTAWLIGGCVPLTQDAWKRLILSTFVRHDLTPERRLCQPIPRLDAPCLQPTYPVMNESILHVGNLPYSIERDDLEAMFLNCGTVVSASLMTYKFDSRSRGFGFVEMATPEEARNAVEMYNGREVRERKLAVNLARPRTASFVKQQG